MWLIYSDLWRIMENLPRYQPYRYQIQDIDNLQPRDLQIPESGDYELWSMDYG